MAKPWRMGHLYVKDKKATGDGHYALRVNNRGEVNAFHRAALKAGGKDNGKPGPRPAYGSNYYAAFVRDREGNNIEVVCYAPSAPRATSPRKTATPSPRSRTQSPKSPASPAKRTSRSLNGRSMKKPMKPR